MKIPADLSGGVNEFNKLSIFLNSENEKIAVIYGRRRIGKSFLIEKATQGSQVFNFEGLELASKSQQIRKFLILLEIQTGEEIKRKSQIKSWSEVFVELLPYLKQSSRPVLVLDEFQWMANYKSELVAELKLFYDQFFSKIPRFKLILCGSIASFLIKKVIQSKSLYGRIDLNIHLVEFSLAEVKKILPKHSKSDCLLAYLIFGGIPKYLSLIRPGESIPLAAQRLIFNQIAPLSDEYDKIFISHFGKSPVFAEIIELLRGKPFGLLFNQIVNGTSTSGGGQTTRELFDLEMAGFIKSFVMYNSKVTSKMKRYKLSDPFCSFYLNFVKPNLTRLDSIDFHNHIFQSAAFKSWLGITFELACFKHRNQIAKLLGFAGVSYSVGPYWSKDTDAVDKSSKDKKMAYQFDLVFSRADKIITICEAKFQSVPVGIEIGAKLSQSIANIKHFQNVTTQRVLITNTRPSKELLRSSHFSQVITAEELFTV